MPDDFDDIDDELLGLAEGRGGGSSKRKSKSKSSSKRKRSAVESDSGGSDMDMSGASTDDTQSKRKAQRRRRKRNESDDDDDERDNSNNSDSDDGARPKLGQYVTADDSSDEDEDAAGDEDKDPSKMYPLEGKYKDEAERDYIDNLPEVEREQILGERADEIAEWNSRQQLREMVRMKERREAGAAGSSDEEGASRRKGGRNRTATGATKTKTDQFAKLREKREKRQQRKDTKSRDEDGDEDDDDNDGGARRAVYSSENDYSDESEDDRKAKKQSTRKAKSKQAEPASQAQLRDCFVTRIKLSEFCNAPWFEEWVTGAWVRCLLGVDQQSKQRIYRLCEVRSVKDVPEQPYKLEGRTTTKQLELAIAGSSKVFKMEFVSDSPFTDREFDRLKAELRNAKMDLPSAKEATRLKNKLAERKEYIMTEADVAAELAKKGPRVAPAVGKARLLVQRDFARSSGDEELLAAVNAELAKLEAPPPGSPGGASADTEQERMRRVNERNRMTNRTEIQRAEAVAQAERRRQEAALARGETDVKIDPSARVKTMTRLKYDKDSREPSRPGTPGPTSPSKKAVDITAADKAAADNARSKGSKFEEMVAAKVDIDIDLDF
ncbi:RNA polymerase-associated protein rtf1 [Microbotryomycetes sp. JL221]|nr:RNA polymerase-associated protein rtf1 [Microbotryomycetes sp. JL221]